MIARFPLAMSHVEVWRILTSIFVIEKKLEKTKKLGSGYLFLGRRISR